MKLASVYGLVIAACVGAATSAQAGLVVIGSETTTPGVYQFTFNQDLSVMPVQSRAIIPLGFSIDLSGLVLNSTAGTLTDGTTALSPALTGWTDATITAPVINPNLITSINSGPLMLQGDAGIDFSLTNVTWRFTSAESFAGNQLDGFVQQAVAIPEPSSLAVLVIGLGGWMHRRSRRRIRGRRATSGV